MAKKAEKVLKTVHDEDQPTRKRSYVCNKYPFMSIRNVVKFEGGLFETEDAEAQALVESNDLWMIHIWPKDGPPVEEEAGGEPDPSAGQTMEQYLDSINSSPSSEGGGARHGSVSTAAFKRED